MANIFEPSWDSEQDRPPFTWHRAYLGRQAGSKQLGCSLYELPPGCSSFPLHIHHANEELIIVLDGRPTLRTMDAERQLETGEVVACLAGPAGAHRLDNHDSRAARVLVISTMLAPELNEYPDSNKYWARNYPPGAMRPDDGVEFITRASDQLDYLDGET